MVDWGCIGESIGFGPIAEILPAGGGCIHQAATLTDSRGERVFVKANVATKLDMFESEAEALTAIAATGTLRVPHPLACGAVADTAYLAMEFIDLVPAQTGSWEKLGVRLAELHATRSPDGTFGWHRDNVIGETRQPNPKEVVWPTFFSAHRLRHQFELAESNGYRFERSDELLRSLPQLLDGHEPAPALLHGDLWSGNTGFDSDGEPVIYDPASYYGDAETDLAFTEMFGRFASPFYQAYHAIIPPSPGSELRKTIYNLYHLLNHTNLFGRSYEQGVRASMAQLLRA